MWVNWVWVRVSGAVNDNVIRHPSAALARGTLISIIAISGYYNLCEVSGSESKREREEGHLNVEHAIRERYAKFMTEFRYF